MTRRFATGFVLASYLGLAATACGDVKSDLITGATGGAAGAPGGASTGGASSGSSGMGGTSPTGGASAGGAGAGGAGSGGASAGSSSGGATGGSAGTPECTVETADTDCTGPDRNLCNPDTGTCVECTAEAHCDADEDCSDDLGECAERCAGPSDCTDDEDRFCDLAIGGFCVECLADADCPSNQCSNWSCD
jgi:hypothetical protein